MINKMLIQDAKATVPILADKHHYYVITVNEHQLVLNYMEERELAYAMYSVYLPIGYYGETIERHITRSKINYVPPSAPQMIRSWLPNISAQDMDKVVELFKEHHPLEPIEKYTERKHLLITEPGEEITLEDCPGGGGLTLTHEQEKELLQITKERFLLRRECMIDWFKQYCFKYGFDQYTKDLSFDCELMTTQFCVIHGLSPTMLSAARDGEMMGDKTFKGTMLAVSRFLIIMVPLILAGIVGIWLENTFTDEGSTDWGVTMWSLAATILSGYFFFAYTFKFLEWYDSKTENFLD